MIKYQSLAARCKMILILAGFLVNSGLAETFGNFTYTDNGSSITITGYPAVEQGALDIPASIDGKPVTSIGDYAFQSSRLTSLTIPVSVTSIGVSAFFYCDSLTGVTIPASVTSIGDGAFRDCHRLTTITVDPLNSDYSSVDGVLFNKSQTLLIQCPVGKEGIVTIPASVISIGKFAFSACLSLTSVTIPTSVISIGKYAFFSCSSLTSVMIPASVTSIGESAFAYCGRLTSMTIPTSVTSIGDSAFFSCDSLTNLTIPISVTSIGNSAFAYCRSLTSMIIPGSVTGIGYGAFRSCLSLRTISVDPLNSDYSSSDGVLFNKSQTWLIQCPGGKQGTVTVPASVSSIGGAFQGEAFKDCRNLSTIMVDPANSEYSSNDGILFNKSQASLLQCPGGKEGAVTIPTSVTSIGDSAFDNCSGLTSVTIPASVTSIGDGAFTSCSNLTSVTIPNGVTSIGYGTFQGCGLISVTIPASVTSIGDSAFEQCSSLTSVTIPASVTSIGHRAFSFCELLTSVTIPASVTSIGDWSFASCGSLTSVTIPTSVTSIGDWSFASCGSLMSVTIPSSVTSIGDGSFVSCSSLRTITVDPLNSDYSSQDGVLFNKSQTLLIQCPGGKEGAVTIPASVTSIGYVAFLECNSLTMITVDPLNPDYSSNDGVLFNKSQTLLIRCPGGKEGNVTIPTSVTSIEYNAFSYRGSLMTITVDPLNSEYSSHDGLLLNKNQTLLIRCPGGKEGTVMIPASVTSIGESAFQGCSSLTGVTIPTSVTRIGDEAFHACTSLVSVSIPTSVTRIEGSTFGFCTSLTSVVIPASVTSIGYDAFAFCSSLTSVTIPASVTSIDANAFSRCGSLVSAIFTGHAPSIHTQSSHEASFSYAAPEFTVYYFDATSGFTSPTWMGYPAVNMGASSPVSPWLVSNGFLYNTDLQADPNGDGVNLLMAYALKLDPKQNLSGSMPQPVIAADQMRFDFYAGSDGISYTVECSTDLQNWSTAGVSTSTPDADHIRTASITISPETKCFMRLSVAH